MITALLAMAGLALAALITLSGCGGVGTPTEEGPITGTLVRGKVVDDFKQPVAGFRVTILSQTDGVLARVLSGSDGSFEVRLPSTVTPKRFLVDPGNRASDYYGIVTWEGRTVDGCAFDLPAPNNNVIDIGSISVYSQNTPPPPPHDVCF